jgi:hypothetical protein
MGGPWETGAVRRPEFAPPGRDTRGGVVEWLMAPVLKTGEGKPSAGSNPAPSVSELKTVIPKGSRDVPLIPETRCPAVGFLLFGRPMASQ